MELQALALSSPLSRRSNGLVSPYDGYFLAQGGRCEARVCCWRLMAGMPIPGEAWIPPRSLIEENPELVENMVAATGQGLGAYFEDPRRPTR